MVKAIFEHDGESRNVEGQLGFGIFATDLGDMTNVQTVCMGYGNIGMMVNSLAAAVPKILEEVSEDKIECIAAMIDLNQKLDHTIKDALKDNADIVADKIREILQGGM